MLDLGHSVGGGFHFGPTKAYRARAVARPVFLRDRISEHLARGADTDPEALVLTAPRGGPLRRKEFSAGYWKPALVRADIEHLCVHVLSHTCASLLIATGANPKAGQTQVGHSSIQVTLDRYDTSSHRIKMSSPQMDHVYLGSLPDTRRTPDGHRVVELTRERAAAEWPCSRRPLRCMGLRLVGGGGRESNPPGTFRPPTGFEDRGAHQALVRLHRPG